MKASDPEKRQMGLPTGGNKGRDTETGKKKIETDNIAAPE